MDKRIIIYGANHVGRGIVADLFYLSGYNIVFVDKDEQLVKELNDAGQYSVIKYEIADEPVTTRINRFAAVGRLSDEDAAKSDVAAFALTGPCLDQAAKDLAALIQQRTEGDVCGHLDVILCANALNPSARLEQLLEPMLSRREKLYFDQYVDLVDLLVMETQPELPEEIKKDDPLAVPISPGYGEVPLNARVFLKIVRDVPGFCMAEDIKTQELKRFYTYDMARCMAALIGAQNWLSIYCGMYSRYIDPGKCGRCAGGSGGGAG